MHQTKGKSNGIMNEDSNPTSMPLSISPNERDVKLIIGDCIIQPGFTDRYNVRIVNSTQESEMVNFRKNAPAIGVENSEMIGWRRLYELACIGGVGGIEGKIRVRGVKNGV